MKKEIYEKYNIDYSKIKELLKEPLIEFFGEKHRNQILDNLENIKVNAYFSLNDIRRVVNNKRGIKKRELALKFLDILYTSTIKDDNEREKSILKRESFSSNLTDNQKKILKGVFDDFNNEFSENEDLAPIYSFGKYFEVGEDESEYFKANLIKNECKVLNTLGLDIDQSNYHEVIKTDDAKEKIELALLMKKYALELKKEYNEFDTEFQLEEEYFKECEKISNDKNLEYVKKYYSQIIPFVDENTKENIQHALQSDITNLYKFTDTVDKENIYLGYGIKSSGAIEFFSKESDEAIEFGKTDYEVNKINKNREKYFSCNDNLQAPSHDLVDNIKKIRTNLQREYENDVFKATSSYYHNVENIEKLGLMLEAGFSLEEYKQRIICCNNNLQKDSNGNDKLAIIMNLPLYSMLDEYKDTIFIHELLHGIEFTYRKKEENTYIFKTGFEEIEETVGKIEVLDDESRSVRETELFSENIHQLRTMEFTEYMHDKGIYLFDDPHFCKTRGGTSYERYNYITSQLYTKYKNEINDARFSKFMDMLYEKIGKENFYRINDMVNEYEKLPYYNLMRDLQNGENTPLVKKRQQIGNSITKIMKDIESLYNEKNNNKSIEDNIVI